MWWSKRGVASGDAPDGAWGDAPEACLSCGRVLDGDPDEDPTGNAGEPICGECARERDFFVLDIADGELDGEIA